MIETIAPILALIFSTVSVVIFIGFIFLSLMLFKAVLDIIGIILGFPKTKK